MRYKTVYGVVNKGRNGLINCVAQILRLLQSSHSCSLPILAKRLVTNYLGFICTKNFELSTFISIPLCIENTYKYN